MKRLLLSLATASFATGALAAFPINSNPANSFLLGATGYYLRASATNGDFDYASNDAFFADKAHGFIDNLDPSYDWGWGIHGTYFAPNGVNDITIRYFHSHNTDTDSDASAIGEGISPFVNAIDAGFSGSNVTASMKAKVDQVDLIGGQNIGIRSCLNLHPFFGLRWAEIKRSLDSAIYDNVVDRFMVTHNHSRFEGLGPVLGMDANYFLTPEFSLVARMGTALLVGEVKPHLAFFSNDTPVNVAAPGAADFHPKTSSHRVVPVIDMKLGADYTYMFNSSTISAMSLELGWKFTEYFNVNDNINATAATLVAATIRSSSADLSLQGPYAELSVAF